MLQQMVMEADADQFVRNELYYNALPRPSYEEYRALDLSMIEKGQLEPIKVNKRMEPLDGYTRHQILGDRGVKIKYEFRYFETMEEELDYVVECNVMRRHLNQYQKVKGMRKLFGDIKYTKENADKFKRSYVDILISIKDGNKTTNQIVDNINKEVNNTRLLLTKMTEQYFIKRKKSFLQKGGCEFIYDLMPKGVEMLEKKPFTKTTKSIGKDIGMNRNTVGKALYLIDNASVEIQTRLDNGTLTVGQAYAMTMKLPKKEKRWNEDTKIKCPYCDHVAEKAEYTKV